MARHDCDDRAQQLYDWGMNSNILGLDEFRCQAILDSFGIYDRAERDQFWEGFHAVPDRNYIASITIRGSEDAAYV